MPTPPQPHPSPLEPPPLSPLPGEPGQPAPEPAQPRSPGAGPLPVTPSDKAERPDGLAFDVEPGADLAGVPAGDQVPDHPGAEHTQKTVREYGYGVGLDVPGSQDPAEEG
jgi:hypothetical protein